MTEVEGDRASVQCQQCGSRLALRRFDKTVSCPYCQSTNVVQRPPREGIPTPSFVIGFARPEAEVRELVKRWGRRAPWYAPRGFKQVKVELLKPVYLPAYLYSGEADVSWRAVVGYAYRRREGNKSVSGTEWHPLDGEARLRVLDLLVSASHQVKNDELERIEPYDLGRLAVYSDAALAGWPAEEAARTEDAVGDELDAEAGHQLRRRIERMIPGEKRMDPKVSWNLRRTHVDLVLVPAWTMLVRYSPTRPRVRVLVNGQTGKVWGAVPVSGVKIAAAVLAGLAVLTGVVWFFSRGGHL